MKEFIPLFYYPTRILFLDDDLTLLDNFSKVFGEATAICTDKPDEALEILSKNKNHIIELAMDNFTQESNNDFSDNVSNKISVGFDFANILKICDDSLKSQAIGTIVVDYRMPTTDGLEFCQKIKDQFVKKILLTGTPDLRSTIAALTQGTIHGFVEKGELATIANLKEAIHNMQNKYFMDLTEPLHNNLEAIGYTLLTDPAVIKFFNDILKDKAIKEYYLFSNDGAFLLIDENNNKFVLLLQNDEILNNFIELYASIDEVQYLVAKSANKEFLPFFGIDIEPLTVNFIDWERCFHPAQIIKGKQKNYYWSLIPQ